MLPWLEATSIGTMVRESLYGFPIIVGLHILGIALSVGTLLWFDLRLVGAVLPTVPVRQVYRRLIPWSATGFAMMFTTGGMLFTGYAVAAVGNTFFRVKIGAMVLAAANALYYHLAVEPSAASWESDAIPPAAVRRAGYISMALWAIVILCGRVMSYTMF